MVPLFWMSAIAVGSGLFATMTAVAAVSLNGLSRGTVREWEEAQKMERGLVYVELCERTVQDLSSAVGVSPEYIVLEWRCARVSDAGVYDDGELHWTSDAEDAAGVAPDGDAPTAD